MLVSQFYFADSSQTQQQVLKAVKRRFPTSRKSWKKFAEDTEQAIVILATPRFAKWLEDDAFIAGCLKGLTPSIANDTKARKAAKIKASEEDVKIFEIDVVCACVDGLSPNVNWMPYSMGQHASEGFSILQGQTADILPDLWDSMGPSSTKSPTRTASLTFPNRSDQTEIQAILPLANTLFSNGKPSTLLVSKWRAENNLFVRLRRLEKSNQTIHAYDTSKNVPSPATRVPATPLTPARRIVSGLGNIVKQLDFNEERSGPASRELERNIDEYLARTQREKSTIAVWALIVPKHIPNLRPEFDLLQDAVQVKAEWSPTLPERDFIGYWVLQGAKLCRVLSGGGGWGVKQGLLSLDPQSTFDVVNEARIDFSTGSIEDQQSSALGNIAEVDALIQFFVANTTVPFAAPPQHPVHGNLSRRTTVIGAVPSTIDDPKVDEDPSPLKTDHIFLPRHFGAVSESGLFLTALRHKDTSNSGKEISNKAPIHTKIDLPYSYVYSDMAEERDDIRKTQVRKHFAETQRVVKRNQSNTENPKVSSIRKVTTPLPSGEFKTSANGRDANHEELTPSLRIRKYMQTPSLRIRKHLTQSPFDIETPSEPVQAEDGDPKGEELESTMPVKRPSLFGGKEPRSPVTIRRILTSDARFRKVVK